MQRAKSEMAPYCMVILAGIVLIIVGIININISEEFMETAVKTQALVTDIMRNTREYTDWEGQRQTETSYLVLVEFYIKNKKIDAY